MFLINSFFCGAGGMDLGFQKAGFDIMNAWDFDEFAVKSYKKNVCTRVMQADVSNIDWRWVPRSDVWTFGFPCQDISIAGEQAGLDGSRSRMFFEIMRLLREVRIMSPSDLPKIILAENVKQLKKHLPRIREEYAKQGYVMYYTLYNSKYWGVPQNRERYFIVGVRKDLDKGYFEFLPENETEIPALSSVLESDVPEKYFYSDEKCANILAIADKDDPMKNFTGKDGTAYACNARYYKGVSYADITKSRNTQIVVLGAMNAGTTQEHNNRVHDPSGISPTVTAVAGGTHHIKILDRPKHRVRKLTPREYARLQGFPDSFEFVVSDTQLYRQFGNAVTVPVAEAVAKAIKNFLEGIE